MMPRLAAEGLGLRRAGRWILRDVSIALEPGAVTAIVGPNGSGKSSLLRCLGGLWAASAGSVRLGGEEIGRLKRADLACQVAYVPQDIRLDFEFSVREVILMGRYPHRGRFERESARDRAAADAAMRRADVAHLGARAVTELSGGERQRVLIARSLATEARILLLDEPTSNLDVDHTLDVLELCRALADDGRAVAIATHDLNAVCRFVDRVALLDGGRMIAFGAPPEVLTSQNLEQAFRIRSETVVGADGTPLLLFRRLGAGSGQPPMRS